MLQAFILEEARLNTLASCIAAKHYCFEWLAVGFVGFSSEKSQTQRLDGKLEKLHVTLPEPQFFHAVAVIPSTGVLLSLNIGILVTYTQLKILPCC